MSHSPVLSLAELELFDPHAPPGARRRFCCPLCGVDKPRDAAHRSLSLESTSGLWNCFRCEATGRLKEFWAERDASPGAACRERTSRRRTLLTRAFEVSPTLNSSAEKDVTGVPCRFEPAKAPNQCEDTKPPWQTIWEASIAVKGTAGEKYAKGRALSLSTLQDARVRFTACWHRRAALVFPFCDRAGEIVAVGGRRVRDESENHVGAGPKTESAFFAPAGRFEPFDERVPAIIVVEAPLDALSLAQCGFPALALGGKTPPRWLGAACAFRHVLLATDADEPGDEAAIRLGTHLATFGARIKRLRPEGEKDWNKLLQIEGEVALSSWLAEQIL